MTRFKRQLGAMAIGALGVLAFSAPVFSSTFVAWRVTGVAAGDLLNVRAYPSSGSRILVGYPNGTMLSMTGRCTGGIDLAEIGGEARARQRRMVRYQWCEAWLDPQGDGAFRNGWVYGRYISPA